MRYLLFYHMVFGKFPVRMGAGGRLGALRTGEDAHRPCGVPQRAGGGVTQAEDATAATSFRRRCAVGERGRSCSGGGAGI